MRDKTFTYGLSLLLFIGLLLIRYYEKTLFDDGLIDFFKHDYLNQNLPAISIQKTFFTDVIRYFLNSFLSAGILYLFFKQKGLIQFLLIFYTALLIVIGGYFIYAIKHYEAGQYIHLFYTRRVLIQPLALLLLFPALIYQKKEANQ